MARFIKSLKLKDEFNADEIGFKGAWTINMFTDPQWPMPRWIFLLYRFLAAIYFIGTYLAHLIVAPWNGKHHFLVFYTTLNYEIFTLTLIGEFFLALMGDRWKKENTVELPTRYEQDTDVKTTLNQELQEEMPEEVICTTYPDCIPQTMADPRDTLDGSIKVSLLKGKEKSKGKEQSNGTETPIMLPLSEDTFQTSFKKTGISTRPLPFLVKIVWVLWQLSVVNTIRVFIVYFFVLFPTWKRNNVDATLSFWSVQEHAVIAFFIVIEFFIFCGNPIRIKLYLYNIGLITVYSIFTLIYWIIDNDNIIYFIADWNKPIFVLVIFTCCHIFDFLVTFLLYIIYRVKDNLRKRYLGH